MTFPPIKTQAQIDAEEDRRALIAAVYEYGEAMIGLACLVAIVFVPLTMGAGDGRPDHSKSFGNRRALGQYDKQRLEAPCQPFTDWRNRRSNTHIVGRRKMETHPMTPAEHAQHYLAQAEEFVTRRDQAISAGETARVEYLMDQIDEYLDLAQAQLEDTP